MIKIELTRAWSIASKNTFSIKPIKELIEKYIDVDLIIDPFANNSKIANITNDLDTSYDANYNLEAIEFLKLFKDNTVDLVLYDPPYSPRQVKEVYKQLDKTVTWEHTQTSYWSNQKKEISRITKIGGYVISCGWNSGGIGKKYGFEIQEILLVAHGSQHNDTIVVVDKKIEDK